jgi:hypothetical protein
MLSTTAEIRTTESRLIKTPSDPGFLNVEVLGHFRKFVDLRFAWLLY